MLDAQVAETWVQKRLGGQDCIQKTFRAEYETLLSFLKPKVFAALL